MKFGEYKIEVGDLVLITDIVYEARKLQECNGLAKYLHFETVLGVDCPVFEFLDNQEIIYGYQCWWLPLREANEIRTENGLESIDPPPKG